MTVSAVLMAEVLDHYHGTDKRKVWLLAWAEKAATDTRSGWCPRRVLAVRVGVSPSRVSHIAAELIKEGTLKRTGTHRRYPVYVLSPLAGRGAVP